MLRIKKDLALTWPVKVYVPLEGGRTEEHEIDVQYRLATTPELDISDRDIVESHIVGWAKVHDEAGNALPFSKEHLAALMDIPFMAVAFARGLIEFSRGVAVKN